MTQPDALAALRVWGVTVTLAGRDFEIPPLPASAWFVAILGEEPLPVVPGMFGRADQDEVMDMLGFGEVDLDDLIDTSRDALEVASGWRWWAADRMIRSAGAEWRAVSGALVRRGINLDVLPLGAVLNALYSIATEGLDTTKRMQFDLDLHKPPRGMDEETREELAEQMFTDLLREAGAPTAPPS